jgi:hypothetical protein
MSIKTVVGLVALFCCCLAMASESRLEEGRKMYEAGILPSGDLMEATIQGDIQVTGEQVICGACHRRSGMGSMEGQQVVPAVTGNMLFHPLQLPTSKPPATPILRPAYTRESLKVAIRAGVDANGRQLDPLMPRYPLDDESLDILIDYLSTLSTAPSPGVDDQDIHFATIISEGVDPAEKRALLDVMREFFEQKNVETRHETFRAEHAPWHKEWMFKPYRKWVLHTWELQGERETWPRQLEGLYQKNPVFAVVSGRVTGNWRPIHDFCQSNQIPCLFPTTDLPVISDTDFYSIYMNRGMTLEGEGIATHIEDEGFAHANIVQVFDGKDERAKTAAESLKTRLQKNPASLSVVDIKMDALADAPNPLSLAEGTILVVWGDNSVLDKVLAEAGNPEWLGRIYLSTTLYGEDVTDIPEGLAGITYFINPQEMPNKLPKLILRSTGWLRAKGIYSADHKRIQANAYFALKVTGGALRVIRGYFYRDYFLERVEHMMDNAPYTSVYPHIGLAPGQRFVSKGFYIAKLSKGSQSKLENITEWSIP